MKAICTADVSQTDYVVGTTNTDLPENSITFNIVLPLGTDSSYLTITDINGSSTNTSILNIEDNEATYILDTTYYMSGAGTIKLIINGSNNFVSNEINVFVEDTFTSADNIFVEASDGTFTIKKIKVVNSSSGDGSVGEESDPTVPSYVKNITQADINNWNNKSDFSGSFSDLIDVPDDLVYKSVNDLENYYTKNETYTQAEVDQLISNFITSILTTSDIYAGRYETSEGFLIQWGVFTITTTTANVAGKSTIYFPIAYEDGGKKPIVVVNAFSTVAGSVLLGCTVSETQPTYFSANLLRTNTGPTTVGYISVGKKAGA